MQDGVPSRTAYRVALRRAAHQVWDRPLVLDDPLALCILGLAGADAKTLAASDLRAPARASSTALRAFVVARSRFAEDALESAALHNGSTQYVLLGAGLDTFAYRNPYEHVQVFEVDHPATQAWKLDLLRENSFTVPASVHYVSVDFQRASLANRLTAAHFDWSRRSVFAWLGVVPYLSEDGFASTLQCLSQACAGSELVLDYGIPREALPWAERLAYDSLAARVAAAGEPFQLFLMPDEMRKRLAVHGWHVAEDLDRTALNACYFAQRSDDLQCLGSGGHLLRAVLRPS